MNNSGMCCKAISQQRLDGAESPSSTNPGMVLPTLNINKTGADKRTRNATPRGHLTVAGARRSMCVAIHLHIYIKNGKYIA